MAPSVEPYASRRSDVRLREVLDADLPILFEQQLDPEANRMAAFTLADPTDRDAFLARWRRIRGDETVTIRTIAAGEAVARPLYGRCAEDNPGSRRVLEKCGFAERGKTVAFAPARGAEIAELLLELR